MQTLRRGSKGDAVRCLERALRLTPGAAVLSARVSAADTLALTFAPPASGSYTPPAGVYRIIAFRS